MWWRQALEMAQTLLRLMDDLKQTRADVKELRREMDEMSDTVQRLAFELRRVQEREETERKILKLELENHLLRAERGLPPKREPDDAPE
jgi:septal ring factor EnvC (AmiA/AmiB activator)